ncbi:hypothetical protein ABZP36_010581 [Zizania latifolia]
MIAYTECSESYNGGSSGLRQKRKEISTHASLLLEAMVHYSLEQGFEKQKRMRKIRSFPVCNPPNTTHQRAQARLYPPKMFHSPTHGNTTTQPVSAICIDHR